MATIVTSDATYMRSASRMDFPSSSSHRLGRTCAVVPPTGQRSMSLGSSARTYSPATPAPLAVAPTRSLNGSPRSMPRTAMASPIRWGASRVDEEIANVKPPVPSESSKDASTEALASTVMHLQRTRQELEVELDAQPVGGRSDEEKARLRELVDRVQVMLRNILKREDDCSAFVQEENTNNFADSRHPAPTSRKMAPVTSTMMQTHGRQHVSPITSSMSTVAPSANKASWGAGFASINHYQNSSRVVQATPSKTATQTGLHGASAETPLQTGMSSSTVATGLSVHIDGAPNPLVAQPSVSSSDIKLSAWQSLLASRRPAAAQQSAGIAGPDFRSSMSEMRGEPAPEPAPSAGSVFAAETTPAHPRVVVVSAEDEDFVDQHDFSDTRFAALHSAEIPCAEPWPSIGRKHDAEDSSWKHQMFTERTSSSQRVASSQRTSNKKICEDRNDRQGATSQGVRSTPNHTVRDKTALSPQRSSADRNHSASALTAHQLSAGSLGSRQPSKQRPGASHPNVADIPSLVPSLNSAGTSTPGTRNSRVPQSSTSNGFVSSLPMAQGRSASVNKASPRRNGSKSPRSRGNSRSNTRQQASSPRAREFKKLAEAFAEASKPFQSCHSDSRKVMYPLAGGEVPNLSSTDRERGSVSAKPSASPSQNLRVGEQLTLQAKLDAAMQAEEEGIPPDAADKWKVLQLFHESVPRARARVERVQRIVDTRKWANFLKSSNFDDLDIGYYTPAGPSQLARLREAGFCADDFEDMKDGCFGIPVSHHANIAYERVCRQFNLLEQGSRGAERCICVVLCTRGAHPDCTAMIGTDNLTMKSHKEHCVTEPSRLLLAYVLELGVV